MRFKPHLACLDIDRCLQVLYNHFLDLRHYWQSCEGLSVMIHRNSTVVCIHVAVLFVYYAHAHHVVVWGAIARPRLHHYL
jgi:hypothetical protein